MTTSKPTLPPTPVLETRRLILRPLRQEDVPAIQRRFPRWEIVRYLAARVPWHRVINARGEISLRRGGEAHELQRMMLQRERVKFDRTGRVDLGRFRWRGRSDEG